MSVSVRDAASQASTAATKTADAAANRARYTHCSTLRTGSRITAAGMACSVTERGVRYCILQYGDDVRGDLQRSGEAITAGAGPGRPGALDFRGMPISFPISGIASRIVLVAVLLAASALLAAADMALELSADEEDEDRTPSTTAI